MTLPTSWRGTIHSVAYVLALLLIGAHGKDSLYSRGPVSSSDNAMEVELPELKGGSSGGAAFRVSDNGKGFDSARRENTPSPPSGSGSRSDSGSGSAAAFGSDSGSGYSSGFDIADSGSRSGSGSGSNLVRSPPGAQLSQYRKEQLLSQWLGLKVGSRRASTLLRVSPE